MITILKKINGINPSYKRKIVGIYPLIAIAILSCFYFYDTSQISDRYLPRLASASVIVIILSYMHLSKTGLPRLLTLYYGVVVFVSLLMFVVTLLALLSGDVPGGYSYTLTWCVGSFISLLFHALLTYWCYWNKQYREQKSIDPEMFQEWQELFDDSINLYAAAKEKDTLKVAQAAKIAALAIAHRVGDSQKNELVSNAKWILNMSKKLVAPSVSAKYNEVIDIIEQEDRTVTSGRKYMEELAMLDPKLQKAVNSYNGKYLKEKFPSHYK